MKRVLWFSGTGLVVLLGLGGVLLLGANLYVQSPVMQARIRLALSESLHLPTEVRKTTFTPWDGLRIDGIAAPGGGNDGVRATGGAGGGGVKAAAATTTGHVKLSAESFRARVALWPLLSERRLVVRQILFDRPALAWEQTPEGRWRWPAGVPKAPKSAPPTPAELAKAAAADPGSSQGQVQGEDAAPPTPTAKSPRLPPDVVARKKLGVAIERFRLRHGALQFSNRRGEPMGRFEDVNANAQLEGPDHGRGRLWFASSAWGLAEGRTGVILSRFESPFTFSPELFALTDGRGELAGGRVRVDGTLSPAEDGSPAQARATLEGLSLEQLLKGAGVRHDLAAGAVHGEFRWDGQTADAANTGVGRGELRVTGGELRGVPLLATVGDALGIEELRNLRLQDARAECQLQGSNLHLEPLALVAGNLRLDARGDARLDRAANDPTGLDLQARLTVGRAITRQLPRWVEDSFTPVADSADGARYVDFNVKGPLGSPRTDLLDRAVSKPLRSMLEGVFGANERRAGADKDKDKDRKKSEKPGKKSEKPTEPAAAPRPAGGGGGGGGFFF